MYNHEEFIGRVTAHYLGDKAKNGVPWPKDELARWILAWLECKADDNYRWPRWPVAEEAAEAARVYYRQ